MTFYCSDLQYRTGLPLPNMDSLPQELFDAVLQRLAVYDFPVSARFPVLDNESRQAILGARLVQRCFRNSRALTTLFTAVLEDTPLLWHGDHMPRLQEVSRSQYAGRMTTLSLSSINLDPWHQNIDSALPDEGTQPGRPRTFTTTLRRFVCVKHLRYYPISPRCFREAWPKSVRRADAGLRVQYGYPQDDSIIRSWLDRQQDPTLVYADTMLDAGDALLLESVSFPLFGNRASYCGISLPAVPRALKFLSISLTDRSHDVSIFGTWLAPLKHLTFLEIAIARNPETLGPWNSFASCRRLTDTDELSANDQLPRLEEFRLMSDNQNCFSESDLLFGLDMFPNLRNLGLAHILIKSQNNNAASWASFVGRLVPKALRRLWLLDPRNLWTDGHMRQTGQYVMSKYWGDASYRAAAQDVRLINTDSLWVQDKAPPKRRDFDYPGFAIFEQT